MSKRISREVIDAARNMAEERQPEVVRANMEAAQPLVDEIRAEGLQITQIGDLQLFYGAMKSKYRRIVPVLVRWLARTDDFDIRLAIVMALGVPEARPLAARPLIHAFEKEDCGDRRGFHLKSVIAHALSVVADDSVFDDIVRLVKDRRHGQCRQSLVWALGNMKDPSVTRILLDILHSGEELIASQAIRPLGRLRVRRARSKIAEFLKHPDPWVRREAKRAIEKIDKAGGGSHRKAVRPHPLPLPPAGHSLS